MSYINKGIICLLLLSFLILHPVSYAVSDFYLEDAQQLKQLNILSGSASGFELNREPTRLEASIVFVKLLGAEMDASQSNYTHPFTDVPSWGSPYIGYLYSRGYTTGKTDTLFGSEDKMHVKSYLTFLLKALDYNESTGDYSWESALDKAMEIQLIDSHLHGTLSKDVFLRDHLAKISMTALRTKLKDTEVTLGQKLVEKGVISYNLAKSLNLLTPTNNNVVSTNLDQPLIKIQQLMTNIPGVFNYVDYNGQRYYRPLTVDEMSSYTYDAFESMEIHHNDYTLSLLKASNTLVDWDAWIKISWTKFDWNNNSHGANLSFDDYWKDYDGNSVETAGSYANKMDLRLPSESELKSFLGSLSVGPTENLGWPSGYFWTSDTGTGDFEIHRFVDSLNKMGQQYNDTRDYFVILVGDIPSDMSSVKKSPSLTQTPLVNTIYASDKKIKGMKDIPGIANSISVNGTLIYRPLTTSELKDLVGKNKYDFSLPGKYGYAEDSTEPYVITLEMYKESLMKENPSMDWDMWLNLEWPVFDDSFDPLEYTLGTEYEGDSEAVSGTLYEIYSDTDLTLVPKYILQNLYDAYPDGKITSTFGWPTNMGYMTSSRDEFGFRYSTNLYYVSSTVHITYHPPYYFSFMHYGDVDQSKLIESSTVK